MKKLLFVCIENSNRSQMAQAFATIHGKDKAESFSAGSNPSGKINPKAINAMADIGYDLSTHASKSINEFKNEKFEYVITMGCGDACPFIAAKHHIDWQIPDPRNMDKAEFNIIRDLIEEKVISLLSSI
jgi:protein-tyrosine-phosphatase